MPRSLIVAVTVLLLLFELPKVHAEERLSSDVVAKMMGAVVRITATREDEPLKRRVASGFRWLDDNHVVTAMHVVVGAEAISVEGFLNGLQSRSARISKLYPTSDLALLEIDAGLPGAPLTAAATDAWSGQTLWVVGFPLEVFSPRSRVLRLSEVAPKTLFDAVDSAARADLTKLKFPSLDTNVLQIEGDLLHGDSGAPIIDSSGNVVGVGDGGLKNGFAGLGWAIPVSHIEKLIASDIGDFPLDKAALSSVHSQFYSDAVDGRFDQILWETALQMGDLQSFSDYLDRLPQGKFAQQARKHVQDLTAKYSTALSYYRTGMEAQQSKVVEKDAVLNSFDRSMHDFRKAISLYPRFAPAHLELAIVSYYKAGLATDAEKGAAFVEAIDLFNNALVIDPNQAEAYLFRGFAYDSIDNQRYACGDYIRFQRLKDSLSTKKYDKYKQQLRFSREFLEYNGCDVPGDLIYIGAKDLHSPDGDSTPVDQDCKAEWWKGEAEYCAERGSIEAMVRVAGDLEYLTGSVSFLSAEDTEPVERSVRWSDELFRQGNPAGYHAVARMYWGGVGKPRVPRLALQYMTMAAAADNADALFSLGHMLSDGLGGMPDRDGARRAWARAAVLENSHAKSQLKDFDLRSEKLELLKPLVEDFLRIIERGDGAGYVFQHRNQMADDLEGAAKDWGGDYLLGSSIDNVADFPDQADRIVPTLVRKYDELPDYAQQRIRIALRQLPGTPEAAALMANAALQIHPEEDDARINLDDQARARNEALEALSGYGTVSANIVSSIAPLLKSKDRLVRLLTLGVIGETGDRSLRPLLEPLTNDPSPMVRTEVERYLQLLSSD